MSQQINLYDQAFRTQTKPFAASTMAASLGVVILAFVLLHVYLVSQLRGIERASQDSDKALADLRAQIVLLAARNASQGGGPALVEEIARAEARLHARQELLQDITTRVARTRKATPVSCAGWLAGRRRACGSRASPLEKPGISRSAAGRSTRSWCRAICSR